ncbi:NADPH-dependent oxidoreductase [Rhodopila sp.]|jgi:nitroreductase|uniref:NADPH-dependent oxidoreductase n=1 Tax=Rhodopila sp. TaxID=2480087 RepID=UPI002B9456BB|nr:NADPH-dependent oxidoreductase [Rhodopila sp.]HVZ10424.1 NADPH-dependent oxidoreductase [Rhodopila sp.]
MNMSPHAALSAADALALRYGAEQAPTHGPWNEHIALLLSHRSIRGYRPNLLPEGTLETLIAAAQSAATSSNLQTWSVIAVTDPAKKAELAKLANNQKHIEQCPLFLVWVADVSRNQRLGAQERVELETMPYQETFLVAVIDAALAAQNAVVAAESLGLSTVYIGALRNHPQQVAKVVGLPQGAFGVFGMCIGYAAPTAANEVKPRLPQAVVLHHEIYDTAGEPEHRAAYDHLMAAFSARNEMTADTWTKRVINRMSKIAAMSGRDKMVAALHAMGFPLH